MAVFCVVTVLSIHPLSLRGSHGRRDCPPSLQVAASRSFKLKELHTQSLSRATGAHMSPQESQPSLRQPPPVASDPQDIDFQDLGGDRSQQVVQGHIATVQLQKK